MENSCNPAMDTDDEVFDNQLDLEEVVIQDDFYEETDEGNGETTVPTTPEKSGYDLDVRRPPATPNARRSREFLDVHQTPSPQAYKLVKRMPHSEPLMTRRKKMRVSLDPEDYVNPFECNVFERDKMLKRNLSGMKPSSTGYSCKPPSLTNLYVTAFIQVDLLGSGNYGKVFKCKNKTDGCFYAIKCLDRTYQHKITDRQVLQEIYAHAVLKHPSIVQNFFSWREGDVYYIQNEWCKGGSLDSIIEKEGCLKEIDICKMMAHISFGLSYMHSKNLVHMDIKSSNILVQYEDSMSSLLYCEDDEETAGGPVQYRVYKIGDLGYVSSFDGVTTNFPDGDGRYLSSEVLCKTVYPQKSDIFALGMTAYECAGHYPLPKSGSPWHRIRHGNLKPLLVDLSPGFVSLIEECLNNDSSLRPEAIEIHNRLKRGSSNLEQRLKDQQHRLELLEKQLNEADNCLKQLRTQISKKPKSKTNYKEKPSTSNSKKNGETNPSMSNGKTKSKSNNKVKPSTSKDKTELVSDEKEKPSMSDDEKKSDDKKSSDDEKFVKPI